MMAAAVPPLGAAWLSSHGHGKLPQDQREALRVELLRDLATYPGVQVSKAVVREVDKFIESGRVSDSNLGRLERRVAARCSGALSARGSDSASLAGISEFSAATRQQEGSRSARVRTGSSQQSHSCGPKMPKTPMPGVPEQRLFGEGPISKWSDVAKYSKALEIREETDKLSRKREHQKQMAKDLEAQMSLKKELSKASKLEENRIFEHQEVELEQWKADSHLQQDEVRRRAKEVEKEREVQNFENTRRREEEKRTKAVEDSDLVERASRELLKEKEMFNAQKVHTKSRNVMLLEGVTDKKDRLFREKQENVEVEKRKVQEYRQMLEEQEVRNKQPFRPPRGENVVIKGPPGGRKGDDFYTEESIMQQLHSANELADGEEHAKIMGSKEKKLSNQDFLFQQMVERNKNRERALEQKKNAKLQAQAATSDYIDSEQRRVDETRRKNVQYRIDLERQIAAKKAAAPGRGAEDVMSSNEKAVNRHLIEEAEELRQHFGPGNSSGA